jgi:FkbM family methyltransferase
MKRIAKQIVKILPGRHWLVRFGAQLPPIFKMPFVTRLCGAIQRSLSIGDPVVTNLGISSALNITLPSNTPGHILFGTPTQYRGERGALNLSLLLCRNCSVFLDIGANLGYFTYFLRGSGAQLPIHFFEPNTELYTLIDKNVRNNNLVDITGHQVAIGDKCGQAEFYLNLTDSSSSSLETYFVVKHKVKQTQVDIRTLEAFVKEHDLQRICVKVDVEAAEFQFLNGSRDVLNEISYLIIEVLAPAIEQGFISKLIAEGFKAYYINDFTLQHSVDGSFRYVPPEYNWLFCRENPTQLQSRLRGSNLIVK